jgi:transposase
MPTNPAEGTIRIKVRRRGGTVSIEWPASAAHECALLIRVDAAWFAIEPLDMRAGTDKALARVVSVFGEARAHHAYLFINKRANRMKVLVHDGFGLWLCARKLYEGSFIRAGVRHDLGMALSHEQLQAIVVGLPWERLDERAKIRVL